MVISKKPNRGSEDGNAIQAIIEKGGSTPNELAAEPERVKTVQLRLYPSQIAEIDDRISQRLVKIPRHTWILEAIAEKLCREDSQPGSGT